MPTREIITLLDNQPEEVKPISIFYDPERTDLTDSLFDKLTEEYRRTYPVVMSNPGYDDCLRNIVSFAFGEGSVLEPGYSGNERACIRYEIRDAKK